MDKIGELLNIQDQEVVKKLVGVFVLILLLSLSSCSSSIYSMYSFYNTYKKINQEYGLQEQNQVQEPENTGIIYKQKKSQKKRKIIV